jgi:hypothetical protein
MDDIEDSDRADRASRTDPLRPIDLVTKVLAVLFAAWLVATIVVTCAAVLGIAPHTVGLEDVCVTVRTGAVPFGSSETGDDVGTGSTVNTFEVVGLAPGATFIPASLSLCLDDPNAWRLVYLLTWFPTALILGGFLVLVRVLVSRARSGGLFTPGIARLTAVLGWYVVLGALVASLVEAVATAAIVGRAVPGRFSAGTVQYAWDTPWTALLAGVGVLTIARVLHRATAMRQDLDATI